MLLDLSAMAQHDIDVLHAYGEQQFGKQTADDYSAGLLNLFDLLELNPRMAPEIQSFKRKLRLLHYRSHLVFYRLGRQKIQVLRILHHRQNWQAYF